MFTAKPPVYIDTVTATGMQRKGIPDFESQLSLAVASWLGNPLGFCAVGQPTSMMGIYSSFVAYAQWLIAGFPHLNYDNDIAPLVQAYFQQLWMGLSSMPVDPSGQRDAGYITGSLGKLNFVNNSYDLSVFPLVSHAPTQTPVNNSCDQPQVWMDPNTGGMRRGFVSTGITGAMYIGASMGLPATWQQYAAQLGIPIS